MALPGTGQAREESPRGPDTQDRGSPTGPTPTRSSFSFPEMRFHVAWAVKWPGRLSLVVPLAAACGVASIQTLSRAWELWKSWICSQVFRMRHLELRSDTTDARLESCRFIGGSASPSTKSSSISGAFPGEGFLSAFCGGQFFTLTRSSSFWCGSRGAVCCSNQIDSSNVPRKAKNVLL